MTKPMYKPSFGVGVDIESIARFREKNLDSDSLFLNKIFTQSELAYCFSKIDSAPHLAARYAGKEAILKALSSLTKARPNPSMYKQIEIYSRKDGAPQVRVHEKHGEGVEVYLSLSHSQDQAIAFAITVHSR